MNSGQKIILYDKTATGIQGLSWKIYSKIQIGWKSIGVKSWAEAETELDKLRSKDFFDTLQIWSHGVPGNAYIGKQKIQDSFIETLKPFVNRDSLVWFRSCEVFFGKVGQNFANKMVKQLGCRIAAHTRTIGFPWQSGLYSCGPDRKPYWVVETGIPKVSNRNDLHTIFAGSMNFPNDW